MRVYGMLMYANVMRVLRGTPRRLRSARSPPPEHYGKTTCAIGATPITPTVIKTAPLSPPRSLYLALPSSLSFSLFLSLALRFLPSGAALSPRETDRETGKQG